MPNRLTYWIILALLVPLPAAAGENLASAKAARERMALEYRVDGVVEAQRQATLSAEVAGKIESVNFDVDDFVEQGEVVLKIRDREYRAQQLKARAVLDEASANLQAQQLEYRRVADLRKQNLISQAVFDKSKASLKSAEARQDAAEAGLTQAQEQLDFTVVRAPYSGVVIERHVEPGEAVSPGQPIMSGYARGQLRVVAQVPQSLIAHLRARRLARVVTLEDGNSIEVSRITIHPVADPRNHSFTVRFDLPQMEIGLFPGMLVKVAIGIGDIERLLVPRQALVSRAEVNALYVIDSAGRLSLRQVRPGSRYGDRVEILAGLDDNEIIALDPVRAGIEHKRQLKADR